MPFDNSKNDPSLSLKFAAPSNVHYGSIASTRAPAPAADLTVQPAYDIARLGLECALAPDFVPTPCVKATQDPPLREDFCPYTTQWNWDR